MKTIRALSLSIVFGLIVIAGFAREAPAQVVGSDAPDQVLVLPVTEESVVPTPAWGLAIEAAVVVHANRLTPSSSSVTFTNSFSGGIVETSSSGDWWTGVSLPSGALVTGVELEGCDTSTTGALQFGLAAKGLGNITPVGTTGVAATPGCGLFRVNVTSPYTMNNGANWVLIFLNFGAVDSTNSAQAVRVFYKLQVPLASAYPVATFNDVSNASPQYRFIEALAASGITSGCGGGNYCPNDPVTRGQMAVFIAAALGLHWAP